jgi:hypothetical protein
VVVASECGVSGRINDISSSILSGGGQMAVRCVIVKADRGSSGRHAADTIITSTRVVLVEYMIAIRSSAKCTTNGNQP